MKRFLSILLALFATMAVAVPSASGDTWSVVAVDPTTGDVGVAGASCVNGPIGVLAALVPNKGAAATQAYFDVKNRNKVFELLKQGNTAQQIIKSVTNSSWDKKTNIRQYGIVTIKNETIKNKTVKTVTAAGFTGSPKILGAADDMQYIPSVGDTENIRFGVSVQGNTLATKNVVSDALAAFKDNSIGPVALSDRLMRALEAGSKAGGDNRCNDKKKNLKQTAQAAFIMVAKGNEEPFKVECDPDKCFSTNGHDQPNQPWLYLSVVEKGKPKLGPNPLIALRQQYDKWRLGPQLGTCEECNLQAIPCVPPGSSRAH